MGSIKALAITIDHLTREEVILVGTGISSGQFPRQQGTPQMEASFYMLRDDSL